MIFVLGNNDCSYYMHCSKSLTPRRRFFSFFLFLFFSFFLSFFLKGRKTVHIVGGEDGPWKKPGSPVNEGTNSPVLMGPVNPLLL